MCIIVDANAAHQMHAKDEAGAPVLKWLLRGNGKLVVSNELLKELSKTQIRLILTTLDQAGKLVRAREDICEEIKDRLQNSGLVVSNDHHILSIVIDTQCRLVFTHDQPLHQDLKNKLLVPNGCSIYQTAHHASLLGKCRH